MCTLLLVDDSPTQSCYLEFVLSSLGHEVHTQDSANLQPEELKPKAFDIALVSLLLANSNGFEIGLRLQNLGFERVAIVTMSPRSTDMQWAKALGLLGVLDAPNSLVNIRHQLQKMLQC